MELYVAVCTLVGSVIASVVTYMIARGGQSYKRDVFYETKITEFMKIQETKINELQNEVARLTMINLELLEKIIHLEGEMYKHDEKITGSVAE